MRYLIVKNRRLFKLFFKFELQRIQLKSFIYNLTLPNYIRQHALLKLSSIDKNSSFVMLKRRCFLTNNSRSVSNRFKMSRIKLRLMISNNYINGVKKLSW